MIRLVGGGRGDRIMSCNTVSTENNGRTPTDFSDSCISPEDCVLKQDFSGIFWGRAFF